METIIIMNPLNNELPDLDTELDNYTFEDNMKAFKDFIDKKVETSPLYVEGVEVHPETAAGLVTNNIAEFIHVHSMVPQMRGRTKRDVYLRNTYENCVNMMIAYREMLVDCAYDTEKDLKDIHDDRQSRHRLKFFSPEEPEV